MLPTYNLGKEDLLFEFKLKKGFVSRYVADSHKICINCLVQGERDNHYKYIGGVGFFTCKNWKEDNNVEKRLD